MTEQHPSRVGLRIAELRKIHGATQQALAARATVSYSLLRKVERGERPASPSFIAAVARALRVSVLDLTEQPYGVRGARPTSEQAGVPALRQALVEGDDPELDTALRGMDDLRAAVAEIKEFDRRTKHAEVVQALPDVLRHLHRAVLDLPNSERTGVQHVLAATYSYAVVALYRLGHLDLSHLADERARTAAAHGDDPLRAAVAEWNHSLILMFDGAYSAGVRSVKRADTIVDLAQPTPAVPAVRGALHLRAAIIAARVTNSDLAADHLNAARSFAADGQDEANFYGTKFQPAQHMHPRSCRARGASRRHYRRDPGRQRNSADDHRPIPCWPLLDRPFPSLAAARRPPSSTEFAATSPAHRSTAHSLPPASPRDRARLGGSGCSIHWQPPELRRMVRHPKLMRNRS